MSQPAEQQSDLIARLCAIVGQDDVLVDADSRSFYSQDVYSTGPMALAVVRPDSTAELAAAVAAVTAAGLAAVPRGGGMSYTSGYVPAEHDSVMFDLSRMNRVLEINEQDMYVRVECGCTWKELHKALEGTGLRTPYWGTLSGIRATVGGGLSQNSIFWGSGRFGSAADTVIGLEVVLADGSVVHTGAGAQRNAGPFFRHYGPDLTGLFTCDTGALGFKAVASLRLIPQMDHREYASFNFQDYPGLVQAISAISRRGLAMEMFAFDPYLQSQRLRRESLAKDLKALGGVMKSSGSVVGALREGAKVAMAGRRYMDDVRWSLHITVEESTAAGASAAMAEVQAVCGQHGGAPIENTIPKIMRANPFTPLNNVLGPDGERWAPIHVVIAHSRAAGLMDAIEALVAERRAALDAQGIGFGYLLASIGYNGFVIEPVFFWPDELRALHLDTIEPWLAARLPRPQPNPASRAEVERLRADLMHLFSEHGGVHMQIGKAYPYRDGLREESFRVVEAIKQALDPQGRINPGALGLDGH